MQSYLPGNCLPDAFARLLIPGKAMTKTVAIISGGLDSAVLLGQLQSRYYDVAAISFDYGQRHRKELLFAQQLTERFAIPWTLIDLQAAGLPKLLRGSALTDHSVVVPDGHYASDNMRTTVVPNRNVIMLAIAAAGAVTFGAQSIALAVHAGDHPVYPDCRPQFLAAFQDMERLALEGFADLEVLAPFAAMSKTEIVRLGAQLQTPFANTWSCYKGEQLHCGSCGTCHERREAFALAGVADPTIYQTDPVED